MLDRREAIHIKQRHGDADRLLGTAVWIALQRREQSRRVERAKGRGGDRDRAGAGDEIGEQIARNGLASAARERRYGAAVGVRRARGYAEPEVLGEIRLRPRQSEVKLGDADASRRNRHRQRFALMQVEAHGLCHRVRVGGERPVDVEVELVLARVALDIVDVDVHFRAVADVEEARQGRGDDDRVAHGHVGLRGPDLVLRPGDGGQPHRAVERRQIERDGRVPLVVHLDDAREQSERLLRRQIAFDAAAGIAAGVDGAGLALHAVDQHAPEIADLDREFALPKEIGASGPAS